MKVTPRRPHDRAEPLVAQPSEWLPPAIVAGELASALADAPLFDDMEKQEIARALANFDEARYPSGRRVLVEACAAATSTSSCRHGGGGDRRLAPGHARAWRFLR